MHNIYTRLEFCETIMIFYIESIRKYFLVSRIIDHDNIGTQNILVNFHSKEI